MKDQIQFETNGLTVLAVKWPKDASDLVLPKVGIADLYFYKEGNYEPEESYLSVGLTGGNWKLHAVTDSMTTPEIRKLCKMLGIFYAVSARVSLKNRLRSHGIDPAEKWVLLVCE